MISSTLQLIFRFVVGENIFYEDKNVKIWKNSLFLLGISRLCILYTLALQKPVPDTVRIGILHAKHPIFYNLNVYLARYFKLHQYDLSPIWSFLDEKSWNSPKWSFILVWNYCTSYCIVFMGLVNLLISDKSSCGKNPIVINLTTARLLQTVLSEANIISSRAKFDNYANLKNLRTSTRAKSRDRKSG